jgi:hypothetical protein
MSIKVILNSQDIKYCNIWARKRSEERKKAGKEATLKYHEIGCYGEYAVVKYYNCEWTGKYYEDILWKNRTWDTAKGEVRATFRPDILGGMKIYPKDIYSDAPYIWVVLHKYGSAVKAQLVGWIYLRDARKDKWWNAEEEIWVIPPDALNSMELL